MAKVAVAMWHAQKSDDITVAMWRETASVDRKMGALFGDPQVVFLVFFTKRCHILSALSVDEF